VNAHLPFHLTIKESVQAEISAVPHCPITFPPLYNNRVKKETVVGNPCRCHAARDASIHTIFPHNSRLDANAPTC
jgi:hypothetical protein